MLDTHIKTVESVINKLLGSQWRCTDVHHSGTQIVLAFKNDEVTTPLLGTHIIIGINEDLLKNKSSEELRNAVVQSLLPGDQCPKCIFDCIC